jgi:Cu/Ag efflux protein CusF
MTIMAGIKRGDKVDIILLRKDEKKTISVVLE